MTALHDTAPAKVNLCLFLGPARASDGRHELVSVMQSLTLADDVTLEPAPPGATEDEVVCPGVDGPNLAARALAEFRAATGWDAPPQRLTIAKRVPVAAGLGGGSGDAAAVLRLAARAAGLENDDDDALLLRLATALGADVPAQVRPGRALATGAGERIRRLGPGAPLGVLVLPHAGALSTAAVYAEADRLGIARSQAGLGERLAAVERAVDAPGDGELPAELLVNDLEPAALSLEPAIDAALDEARTAGAGIAMVSGSGPTVLGLFPGPDGPASAREAAARLAGRTPAPVVAEPVAAAGATTGAMSA